MANKRDKKGKISYEIVTASRLIGLEVQRRFPFFFPKRMLGLYTHGENRITHFLGSIWKTARSCGGNTSDIERFIFWLSENVSHEFFHHFSTKETTNHGECEERLADMFATWMMRFDYEGIDR